MRLSQMILKLIKLISLFVLFSNISFSQDISGLLKNVNINKAEVRKMINFLESNGQISKEEASKARLDLKSKSDQDMENLKQKVFTKIKSGDLDDVKKLLKSKPNSKSVFPNGVSEEQIKMLEKSIQNIGY